MEPTAKQVRNTTEEEIDLLEILRALLQRIWLLAIGTVVGGVVLFCYSRFMITPQYTAESLIYVFSKSTSITNLADLQLSSQLTEDFTIIAKTREVMETVIEDLNMDTTYEALSARVSVANPSSSHMLRITVRWDDPAGAATICNTLADELREQIADIMATDRPSVVQRAVVPTKKSSPSNVKNAAIGAVVGFLIIAAIIIIRYLMDDTLKTDDDVRKYLNLNTIAMIPYVRTFDDDEKAAGKSKHRKSSKSKTAKSSKSKE